MSTNQLADSSSPYLRQHADNPVHWYPWGEEALLAARKSNKPILLSIGYAACHWCHVMAKESFSCEQTAEVMNRLFINIKVDKEERPDLDKIYQTAHALISRHSGGWPLTIFLEPQNQKPFFSGTYFPKEPRFNVPPFRDVLQRVHSFYMQHQNEVQSYGEEISRALGQLYAPGRRGKISDGVLSRAVDSVLGSYDRKNGGFDDAPKFPNPGYLNVLLAQALTEAASGSDQQSIEQTDAWQCFMHCLTAMSQSGLYDQLGGGYFRYTVDAQWSVPHFEKMLYDNGQLLSLMADAQAVHSSPELAEKTRETAAWLIREMQSKDGAFYSSLDADSDGVEGQFYLWDKAEVKKLLDDKDYPVACMYYGLDQAANCEGQWNLRHATSLESLAEKTSQSVPALDQQLKQIKRRMFQQRSKRVRPHRDDKIMVGWNSLVINGLAKAAMAADEKDYYQTGKAALDFIRKRLWRNGSLHTAGVESSEHWYSAYLDDYASLIEAILSMLQYRWDDDDLRFALQLADAALEKFEDQQNGGYFFTAADQERLLQRPRLLHDDSAPAGYGVLALSLMHLGWLCGREDYLSSADKALAGAAETLERGPQNCSHLLLLHEEIKNPPLLVVIRSLDGHGRDWLAAARKTIGRKLCFDVPADAKPPPALAAKKTLAQTAAYLCYGTHCSQPIDKLQEFKRQLNQ